MKRNVNNSLMSMERKQYGAVLRQLVNAAVEVVRRRYVMWGIKKVTTINLKPLVKELELLVQWFNF